MYVSSVVCAECLLLFFIGLKKRKAAFYYKWVGKNAPFYIYILHMAVAVVLSKFIAFENLMLKSLCVLIISFVIYEIAHLSKMMWGALQQKKMSNCPT